MSRKKNVEVVRLVMEAFNSRDWAEWESHHHADFEWSDPPELPGAGTHRGVGGVRRFLDQVLETGDDWRVEVDDIESVGEDRVLMRGRSVFVGHASRIPIEDPLFQLFDLERGRVRRVQTFRSSAEALKAVGLQE
jgi:ketosteroid isomerase-like protein